MQFHASERPRVDLIAIRSLGAFPAASSYRHQPGIDGYLSGNQECDPNVSQISSKTSANTNDSSTWVKPGQFPPFTLSCTTISRGWCGQMPYRTHAVDPDPRFLAAVALGRSSGKLSLRLPLLHLAPLGVPFPYVSIADVVLHVILSRIRLDALAKGDVDSPAFAAFSFPLGDTV